MKKLILKLICKSKSSHFLCQDKKITSILINARFKIGDSIMLFPLIREIKKSNPNIEIDILTGKDNIFMFENNPYVSNSYTLYNKIHFIKSFFSLFSLRKKKYSVIIEPLSIKLGNYIYLRLINAKCYIGDNIVNKYNIDLSNLSCYDVTLPKIETPIHISDQFFRFLTPLGISSTNSKLEVYFSEEDNLKAKNFIENTLINQKIIGINLDGSAKNRSFSSNDYSYLIEQLSKQYLDYAIVIITLPKRRQELEEFIKQNKHKNVYLSYKTKTIFEAMALVNHITLLITPDTSFIHIASALSIPFIGVYSGVNNNFALWYPKSNNYKIISSPNKIENSILGFDKDLLLKYAKEMIKK